MLTVFAREQRVSEGAVMLSRDSARFSKFCLSFVFGRKMEVLLFNVFVVLYKKKSLDDWSLPKPINLVSLKCQGSGPRRNIEILGKQNLLFPSRPVIKC